MLKKYLGKSTGLLRGIFTSDRGDKLISIKISELRELDRDIRMARANTIQLAAFVLDCAANNPAAPMPARQATELLERLGITPREPGTIFHNRLAEFTDVAERLDR